MIVYGLDIENKKEVMQWLDGIRKCLGDARPLWQAMIPKIKEFVAYEFHPTQDSHKGWASLKKKYKESKIRAGHAPGIGVRTGRLAYAAGEKAIKTLNEKSLIWQLDESIPVENGERYAKSFHFGSDDIPARNIYKYTALRVNSFLTLDFKQFNSGATHASFTYAWFKKSLQQQGFK